MAKTEKYIAHVKVEGWLDVEVRACSPREVEEKACDIVRKRKCDLNKMTFLLSTPTQCVDKNGKFTIFGRKTT